MANYTSTMVLLLRLRQGELGQQRGRTVAVPLAEFFPATPRRAVRSACLHPALVASSIKTDKDAIESSPSKNGDGEDVDELAAAVGKLDVDNEVNKCMICFTP